jgi:hypothetical protein
MKTIPKAKTLKERREERNKRRMQRLQGTKTKINTDPFTKLNPEE